MPSTTLPYAETSLVRAFLVGTNLLIYVEGYTSGFGGKLRIERSPNKSMPPAFDIFSEPGNPGINPGASPKHVPTWAIASFMASGVADEIKIIDAKGGRPLAVASSSEREPGSEDRGDWLAVHNLMPGTPGKLRVAGWLEAPRPGYSVQLRESVPQGINPNILLLDLDVTPPENEGIALMTPVFTRFELDTRHHYSQVTIKADGLLLTAGVTIDVQIVQ